jgi:hypothetical protein
VAYQKQENGSPYCIFAGIPGLPGGDCPHWTFAAHNYEWPDGQLIQNGAHTLQATAVAPGNRTKSLSTVIEIQLPLKTDLIQTGPGTTGSVVSDALVFQLETRLGPRFGDGHDIIDVDMALLAPDGSVLRQVSRTSAPYCLFGDGSSCPQWDFAAHNYAWENGALIQNGPHKLRATVQPKYGSSQSFEFPIQIQLPLVTKLLQTKSGATGSVISETLVFQLEAKVGPRYEDGKDIDKVDMYLLAGGGAQIHANTVNSAPYCLFKGLAGLGSNPCPAWIFANHANEWPNGSPIGSGPHTLRAIVYTEDGRTKTVDQPIQISLKGVEPPGDADKNVYLPTVLK